MKKKSAKSAKKKVVKKTVKKAGASTRPTGSTGSLKSNSGQSKKSGVGTPYGDRVLIKPAPVEQQTTFGLVLVDSGKEKPETGIVVAVGPGKRGDDNELVPVGVSVGDTIMFSKYGYDEVKINGEDYYLIREDSITYVF